MRAIALVQAGEIRDAEADARLALEIKLTHSPPEALIWGVFPLVDALTELGEFADAEAVLATTGYLGDPPPGALAAPMLLESRARLRLAQHRHADAHADLLAAGRPLERARHPPPRPRRVARPRSARCSSPKASSTPPVSSPRSISRSPSGSSLPGPRGAGLRALARTVEREEADPPARAGRRPARGVPRPARACPLDTPLDVWQRVQDVNVRSVYLCCRLWIPRPPGDRWRLGDQHRVVRGGHGRRHVSDLLHRLQGRGPRAVARAGASSSRAGESASTRCARGR